MKLAFLLRAHTAVQGHTYSLEMSPSWNDMYDGFSFLVGHDWSFVTRIEGDG
jgi:hypothetical protein